MSKVLLINGSPNEHGCTYTALCEVAASLEKNGIETEMLYLGKAPVPGCIACFRPDNLIYGQAVLRRGQEDAWESRRGRGILPPGRRFRRL